MMKPKITCLILALESNLGAGRNMEAYYKCLKKSKLVLPIMIYTDEYAFTRAPKWVKHKIEYLIPKNTHDPEDCEKYFCTLPKEMHRTQHDWNIDCVKFIIYLRKTFGEKVIWLIDTTNPEIENYMGRYIIQAFHSELFDVYSYFNDTSKIFFSRYWIMFPPGKLLRNLVVNRCGLSANDNRFNMIGRVLDDTLYDRTLNKKSIMDEYKLNINNKTILYAPTWESKKIWSLGNEKQDIKNLKKFYSYAKKMNLNIILRPHPISIHHYGVKNLYLESMKNEKNVYFDDTTHSNIYGPNKSLIAADVLITDLSSIAIDFMSLGKPVVFIYPPRGTGLWNRLPPYHDVEKISYTARSFKKMYLILNQLLKKGENDMQIIKRRKFISYALAQTDGASGLKLLSILENYVKHMKISDYFKYWYISRYLRFKYKSTKLIGNRGLNKLINEYKFVFCSS